MKQRLFSYLKHHLKFGVLMLAVSGVTGCATLQSHAIDEAEWQQDRRLADVALQSGRPESAITIYRQQLTQAPENTELMYRLGAAYNQSGDTELALHFLHRAADKAGDAKAAAADTAWYGHILRELGRANLAQGDAEAAASALQQAADLLPQDAETLNALGTCRALQQDYARARTAFVAAVAVAPDHLEYRNNLAMSWILDDRPRKGIEILHPFYLRGTSTVKMRQNLALAFAMTGDLVTARTIAKQDLNPAELTNNMDFYRQWQQGEAP
ncbi:tetratricopeptide repeat protein [Photobacterium sp. MCCC 1A19761]|uniref:tetratricopeptide repeat protein n=1 Tax=Photobacterium sp. MCCC 1A19761 TaxID=3115000 RepID=UPI00307DBA7B